MPQDAFYRALSAVRCPASAGSLHGASSPSRSPWLAVLLALSQSLACASSPATGAVPLASPAGAIAGVVRYRLPLRNNPIDPGLALHCYADCQPRTTPEDYMSCLEACPGFETTSGVACGAQEVPPIAACFTARQVPPASEPEAGTVVIGVVAGFSVVVALASVCASSNTQCYVLSPEAP